MIKALIGVVIGGVIGFCACALCVAADDGRDETEEQGGDDRGDA